MSNQQGENNMTRKDFVLIAETIRSLPANASPALIAGRVAQELRSSNAAFDADRFINACLKGE